MDNDSFLPPGTGPSAIQLERAAALRRFNRLAVYLPVGLVALAVLGGTAALVYLVLARPDQRGFISAVADLLLICGVIPLMLLCAIVPGAFFFGSIAMRRQQKAPLLALQRLLWRGDGLVRRVNRAAAAIGRRVADPIIAAESRYAYLTTLADQVKSNIRRR